MCIMEQVVVAAIISVPAKMANAIFFIIDVVLFIDKKYFSTTKPAWKTSKAYLLVLLKFYLVKLNLTLNEALVPNL